MKRRVQKLLTLVSLLLSLIGVAIWISSYLRQSAAWFGFHNKVYQIGWIHGLMRFNIADHSHAYFIQRFRDLAGPPPTGEISPFGEMAVDAPPGPAEFNGKAGWKTWPTSDNTWHWYVVPISNSVARRWNAQILEGIRNEPGVDFSTTRNYRFWELNLPCWYLAAAGALLPSLTFLAATQRKFHQHRKVNGRCPTCSYDLRAHHAGGAGNNCPECGTPIIGRPKLEIGKLSWNHAFGA